MFGDHSEFTLKILILGPFCVQLLKKIPALFLRTNNAYTIDHPSCSCGMEYGIDQGKVDVFDPTFCLCTRALLHEQIVQCM